MMMMMMMMMLLDIVHLFEVNKTFPINATKSKVPCVTTLPRIKSVSLLCETMLRYCQEREDFVGLNVLRQNVYEHFALLFNNRVLEENVSRAHKFIVISCLSRFLRSSGEKGVCGMTIPR